MTFVYTPQSPPIVIQHQWYSDISAQSDQTECPSLRSYSERGFGGCGPAPRYLAMKILFAGPNDLVASRRGQVYQVCGEISLRNLHRRKYSSPVGSHQYFDVTPRVKSIQLVNEFQHSPLYFIITPGTVIETSTTDGVHLIKKDDASLLASCHFK